MKLKNTYLGFTDNKKGVQKGRIEGILDDIVRINGFTMLQKDFIYTYLQKGYKPMVEHDYTYWSERINGYVKPRTVYWLKSSEGSYFDINKTLYEFANYILENGLLDEEKAKSLIQLEQQKREEIEKQKQREEEERRLQIEKEREEQKRQREIKLAEWENIGKQLLTDEVKNLITATINNYWTKIIEVYPEINKEELIKNYLKNLPQRLGNYEHMKNRVQYLIFDNINKNNLNNIIEKDIFMRIYNIEETDSKHTITAKIKAFMEGREYKGSKPKEKFYRFVNGEFIEDFGDKVIIDEFVLYGRVINGEYVLTEESTGAIFSKGGTKGGAVEKAKNNIEKHGVEKIKGMIGQLISKYGISPILKKAV